MFLGFWGFRGLGFRVWGLMFVGVCVFFVFFWGIGVSSRNMLFVSELPFFPVWGLGFGASDLLVVRVRF